MCWVRLRGNIPFILGFNLGISELSYPIEADPSNAPAKHFRERCKASINL